MQKNFWQKLKKPILALAPMAGITDSPFRQLCKKYGAQVLYSEMASVTALYYNPKETLELLRFDSKKERPYVVQLFGSDPKHFAKATEIITKKIVSPKLWQQMEKVAIELFERGSEICDKAGIILVDTKYEFGLDNKGKLMLIDEIHTPDCSRFWVKATYKERFKKGLEPENFDKEFMRIWFKKKGYTGDGKPPVMPKSFINKISKRYITIYEKITGKKFVPDKREIKIQSETPKLKNKKKK